MRTTIVISNRSDQGIPAAGFRHRLITPETRQIVREMESPDLGGEVKKAGTWQAALDLAGHWDAGIGAFK